MLIRRSALTLLLLFPCAVHAVDGIYVTLGGGAAGLEDSGYKDATAFRVGIGSGISKKLAYEISYLSLGTFDAEDSLVAEVGNQAGISLKSFDVEINGIDFSLYGILPLSRRVSVLGRVGLYLWESETAFHTGSLRLVADDDGSDASFGLGLDVAYNWRTSFTFMYDRYQALDTDIEFLSAGIKFTF